MRDDKFTTTALKVNLHPTEGTHWVMFSNQNYFDSFGFAPSKHREIPYNKTNYRRYLFRISNSERRQLLRSVLFICFSSHKI